MADIEERQAPSSTEPEDRTQMFICFILGMGSFVSWNSILTIRDFYFEFFPFYHHLKIIVLVYILFALGTMLRFTYIDTRKGILIGYIILLITTLGVLLLEFTSLEKGGVGNYIGLCIIVAAFGVADAHVHGGMVGHLSHTSPEIFTSYLLGMAASGFVTYMVMMIRRMTSLFTSSIVGLHAGFRIQLALSAFLELLCIFIYVFKFAKSPTVKQFRSSNIAADIPAAATQDGSIEQERLGNKQLLFQSSGYALALYFTFVLTVSLLSAFVFESSTSSYLYSLPVVELAGYYQLDCLGRWIPLKKSIKLESQKDLVIASLLRLLLVPAFCFSYRSIFSLLLILILGVTNGYLTVCIFTAAPKGFKEVEQYALGNLLVLVIVGGMISVYILDWLRITAFWIL